MIENHTRSFPPSGNCSCLTYPTQLPLSHPLSSRTIAPMRIANGLTNEPQFRSVNLTNPSLSSKALSNSLDLAYRLYIPVVFHPVSN